MEFRGRLNTPDGPGEGIAVELRLTDVFLELGSGDGELGRWRLDEVELTRVAGDVFDLTLEGEAFVFVADDAISFAYEGLGYVEATRTKVKRRRRRRDAGQAEALRMLLEGGPEPAPASPAEAHPPEPEVTEILPITQEPASPDPVVPARGSGPSPSAPAHPPDVADGIPVVVEAPAVTFVDTLSTVVGELPGDPSGSVSAPARPPVVPPVSEPSLPGEPVSEPSLPGEPVSEPSLPEEPVSEPPLPEEPVSEPEAAPQSEQAHEDEEAGPVGDLLGEAADANGQAGSVRRLLDRLGRKPDDHTHVYGEAHRTGVITRRVCEICGHVTFDSDRVYRDW